MRKVFLVILLCGGCLLAMGQSTKDSYYIRSAIEAMQSGDNETALQNLGKELKVNPNNGYAHMFVAVVCNDFDSYGYALEYALSALKYLPKSEHYGRSMMCRLLADLYTSAKDSVRVLQYVEQALKEDPSDEKNYYELVGAYLERGDTNAALRCAQTFMKKHPKNHWAAKSMAEVMVYDEQYDEAIRYYDMAVEWTEAKSKDRSRALLSRATVRHKAQRPSEALADLMAATRIDFWNQTEPLLGDLNDTIPDEVLDTLLAAKTAEPEQVYWDILLFDTYRDRREYIRAVQVGKELMGKLKSNSLVHFVASILEHHLGDAESAERLLVNQLSVDSTSAGTYIRLEELYSEVGRYNEAFEMADKALTFDPSDGEKATIYQLRGRMHVLRHEYEEAIDDFMAGMIADPRDYGYWFTIGKLYGLLHMPDKQAEAFEQGKQAYARAGRELKANDYIQMGDTIAAYEAAKTMVTKQTNAEQHYNAACIYAQTGHAQEALAELRLSFEYGLRNFYHVAWDMDLDSLRGMPEFVALVNEFQQLTEQLKEQIEL